ncbi:MAG: pyrimidine-nucleoside phosphorylase [Lachnospiraceae bacterium]|nr:pyrimidine-nucleoside phosphorylase [Lachnospiraceae bacterium]
MRMYDLILKKKYGGKMTKEEIDYIVQGYTKGEIPDYQMSAFLMAVCLKGMDMEETTNLTLSMRDSGETLDLSKIHGIKVDKHSTGGVGDKTSLCLSAMVAACGVPVAKMSGRGLGHTGGTIDKLESIKGFSTSISGEQFFENVNRIKLAIMGQTADLAPADKKIYALRDVTGTVDCIPLIASSIMSKKLASGADAIVLDVKTGSGAFMKTLDDAVALADAMVKIGTMAGKHTSAVITNMDQPLGLAVGNSLEVIEAINLLKGKGPKDLLEDCMALGCLMMIGGGAAKDHDEAEKKLLATIDDGSALKKFAEFIEAQGGDPEYVYDNDKFEKAKYVEPVLAPKSGYISHIQTDDIGMCSLILGGGRETKESVIDLSVGLILNKKLGDKVEQGEPLAYIHSNDQAKTKLAIERFLNAYTISDKYDGEVKTIFAKVTSEGTIYY